LKHYCTTHRRTQWRSALRRCKQRPGQSVEDYAADVESLYLKLDPNYNTPEDEKIEQFLQGLRPEFLTAVAAAAPRDLEEAIDRARAVEAVLSKDSVLSGYSLSKTYLNQHDEETERERTPNMQQLIKESNEKLMREVKQLLTTTATNPRTDNNSHPVHRNNNWRNSSNNGSQVCYNCNQPGHIARNCRTRSNQGDNRNNFQPNRNNTYRNENRCFICTRRGHMAKNCNAIPTGPCPHCHQLGHWGYLCPTKPVTNFQNNQPRPGQTSQRAALSQGSSMYHAQNPFQPSLSSPPAGTFPFANTFTAASNPPNPSNQSLNY